MVSQANPLQLLVPESADMSDEQKNKPKIMFQFIFGPSGVRIVTPTGGSRYFPYTMSELEEFGVSDEMIAMKLKQMQRYLDFHIRINSQGIFFKHCNRFLKPFDSLLDAGHTAEAKPQNSKNSRDSSDCPIKAENNMHTEEKEDGVIRIAWVIPKDATTATDNLTGKECHYFDYPFHTDNKEQVLAGNMELDLETGESFNQIIFPNYTQAELDQDKKTITSKPFTLDSVFEHMDFF